MNSVVFESYKKVIVKTKRHIRDLLELPSFFDKYLLIYLKGDSLEHTELNKVIDEYSMNIRC